MNVEHGPEGMLIPEWTSAGYDGQIPIGFQGHYDARALVFLVDERLVGSIVPSELVRLPPPGVGSKLHPIICLLGRQHDVSAYPIGPKPISYWEAIVAVPYLRRRSDLTRNPRPLVFMPRLYLDDVLAIAMGFLYGFRKTLARFSVKDENYRAACLDDYELCNVGFKPHGSFEPPTSFRHFPQVEAMFDQTHIGRCALLGGPVYICAEIKFDWSSARVRSIVADGSGSERFCRVLPAVLHKEGLHAEPLGAFHMKADWVMTPPLRCEPH